MATSGANCWGETYTIDAWGNLTNRGGVSGMGGCLTESLSAAPATAQNHLAGLSYDLAGNVLTDPFGASLNYDAENRIGTDGAYTYAYDADGNRVVKSNGSAGTMYWPGPSGNLTETSLTGTINEEYVFFNGQRIGRLDRPTGNQHYYFSDHLGSASVITDPNASVQERCAYYPYGGILSCTGSDPNNYKFTGKERDSESGLDNFGKRYYASTIGRWMSTDLVNVTEDRVVNPANTLNKYVYGGNNPLKYIDPDGQDVTIFYESGNPLPGHTMMLAYNQLTGDSEIRSFGPDHSQSNILETAVGWPVPGTDKYGFESVSSPNDLREKFASLTIQTTPEEAQSLIEQMRAHPTATTQPIGITAQRPVASCCAASEKRILTLQRHNLSSMKSTPNSTGYSLEGHHGILIPVRTTGSRGDMIPSTCFS